MSNNDGIVVIGSSGHALVIVGTIRAAGKSVAAIYDDNPARWGKFVLGVPVIGPTQQAQDADCQQAVIGVGDAQIRKQLAERLDLQWATVIHPNAWVDASVKLGAGTVVFAGAIVQPECRIGEHAIINTGATVDHNCILGNFVQVAPGANLCGCVTVGDETFVGAGSVVIENRTLGKASKIGAGAVVVRDMPDSVLVLGCPAQAMGPFPNPAKSDE